MSFLPRPGPLVGPPPRSCPRGAVKDPRTGSPPYPARGSWLGARRQAQTRLWYSSGARARTGPTTVVLHRPCRWSPAHEGLGCGQLGVSLGVWRPSPTSPPRPSTPWSPVTAPRPASLAWCSPRHRGLRARARSGQTAHRRPARIISHCRGGNPEPAVRLPGHGGVRRAGH